jgi:hypothetical protein
MEKIIRGCCTWIGFFGLFVSCFLGFFLFKKGKAAHMQNNQNDNDKKPAVESEAGDPKPTSVVHCGVRMRLDVCTHVHAST